MSPHIDQFRSAMAAEGISAPDVIEDDGEIHRFSTNGRPTDTSGWYALHTDGVPAGSFGCWRADLKCTWCSKSDDTMTEAERKAHHQRIKAMQAQREADEAKRQHEASLAAEAQWEQAVPAPPDHPYLVRKDIQPHGAKVGVNGTLLVPMRDIDGKLWNLERIEAQDGAPKKGLFGGRRKGCYYAIGCAQDVLVVAEGFATGASIHECTGHAVAVAFNAGNLKEVAQSLRKKFPDIEIVVAADDDHQTDGNPGLTKATAAAQAVGGLLAVPIFGADRPGSATDFNDLHQLADAAAVRKSFGSATKPVAAGADSTASADPLEDEPKEVKDSLASQLVAFVVQRAELFHDDSGDSFAMVLSVQETYRLTGAKFKSWLMAEFYKASGKAARDQSVREAMQVLDGLAQHDGEQKAVHIRVAQVGGVIFVDLAQPGSNLAAKIEAGQWSLVQDHEVRFLRPDTMRPLPMPLAGGDIGALWRFVNVPEGAQLLVLTWLLECLRPDGVFPVLELLGEAGSAKSTTQRFLRMLIDPNASNLRSPPKSVEDVFVSAGLNWVVSFENVSHLSAQMQDAMCVLATGGGYAKRKLYSDGEESVINVTRPVVLNGISACVTAHDLIDRSVCVEPQRIQTRREDGDIQREFEAAYPALVGSLFQLMAQTLKVLPDTQLPTHENIRMAGFARLGVALERVLVEPEGEFLRQFHASRQESIARTIDSSPVATALLDWFENRLRAATDMPAKALFIEVEKFKPLGAEAWPKTAKGFGDALRRAAPSLRYVGLEAKSLGKVGSTVKWSVRSCSGGGYLPDASRECRTSREAAENLGKNGSKPDSSTTFTTYTTWEREVSSRGEDHVEVEF